AVVVDLSTLKDMSVTELTRLAQTLDVPGVTGLRKQELIFQILRSRAEKSGLLFRSEEHTSELQSRFDLVCRLLLEKKKQETPPSLYLSSPYTPSPGPTSSRFIFLATYFLRSTPYFCPVTLRPIVLAPPSSIIRNTI